MMPDLGKYAVEVLLAYAVTIALVLGLVVVSWRQSAKARKQLEQLEND